MADPMVISVLLPLIVAPVAPVVARRLGCRTGWLLALIPAGIFVSFWRRLPIAPGEVYASRLPWVPDLGVELAFLADGLSVTFVLLITGIGALVLIYAGGYLGDDDRLGRFYAFMLAFMGAMLGVVLSDNVITMFVFWELTSVFSYMLIGFDHETANGRDSALKVSVRPFLGTYRPTPRKAHEAPLSMVLGPVLLALLGLARGLQPEPFENNVGSAAASAILGETVVMKLKLWHGVDPIALAVLGLSFLTLAAGFGVYSVAKTRLTPIGEAMRRLEAVGPARVYELSLSGLYRGAGWVTRIIQTGYLRHYVLAILVVAVFTVSPALLRALPSVDDLPVIGWRVHAGLLAVLTLGGAMLAVRLRSRLASVAALGVTGAAIALLFVMFSAPDLAMTQIVVETLSVVLLVLVFYHLPRVVRRSAWGPRLRDIAVAVGRPFLTGLWYARPVPGIGKISTVLTFDIGVYLVVLGTSLLIVFTLAEEEG